ncbi:hypothetical protein FOZ63_029692 [Perkinsus olseni]|uniref:Uncharacterized protein n=1 Tax=Perkinsus olseni TaxID=32597 RepID=A0A7J6TKA0_PEROL|nr:hypothetical protein FOZ62_004253 [Perkinsus olseni]KAF4745668.1 hypothetical protein FOZ63_029692 [Perkinsus olseni]
MSERCSKLDDDDGEEEVESVLMELTLRAAGEEPNDYVRWRQLLEGQRLELQVLRERRAGAEGELLASVHQLYERELRVIERDIHIIEDDIRRTRDELKEETSRDSQLQAGLMRLREEREQEAAELRAMALEAEQWGDETRQQLSKVVQEYSEQQAKLAALKADLEDRKKNGSELRRQVKKLDDDMRRLVYQHDI